MNVVSLSVAVCTHNPRLDFLSRTLAGLRAQTVPAGDWELVLVDNVSREPLNRHLDLGWHPRSRIAQEQTLGLTAARQRAISLSSSDLIVFVDDDNVLAPDYLAQVRHIASEWPRLGAFGCGRFTPEWEKTPEPELTPLLAYLAVHEVARDAWSNHPFDYGATPAGAGLCVRADVAREYARRVREDPRRAALGRAGTQLAACEDFDIAQTAIELGYGTGIFRALALCHLMPASRVEKRYLLRLVEGHAYSTVVLMNLYGRRPAPLPKTLLARLRELRFCRALAPLEREIHDARRRGEARAFAYLDHRDSAGRYGAAGE